MGHTQRRKHNWPQIIKDWQLSGKSVTEFCQNRDIYKSDFYRMKKKINTPETNFIKIRLQEKSLVPVQQSILLEVCGKYRIEIRNGFSPETLKSLLSILESA